MSLGEPNNGHWYSGMENFINRPTPTQLKDKDLLKKILLADTTKFMVIHRNADKRQRLEVLYNENRVKWVSRKYLNDQLHLPINDTEQTTDGGLVLLIGYFLKFIDWRMTHFWISICLLIMIPLILLLKNYILVAFIN